MFVARRRAPNDEAKRIYARQWGRVPALEPLECRTLLNGGGVDASPTLPLLIDEQFADMAIDGDRIPTIENHRPNDPLALKISSRLWRATELLAQHDENAFAQIPESRRDANGAVLVTVRVDANNATVSGTLATMGLEITSQRSDYDGRAGLIEGWLPLESVRTAAAMPTVRSIVIPSKLTSQTGSVTSAGDAALKADDVRSQFAALGIDGSGIRIGVISTGVTNRSEVQGGNQRGQESLLGLAVSFVRRDSHMEQVKRINES